MGARKRVGIGLSYRPARLHRLAESIPWTLFLGSQNVYKLGLWFRYTYLLVSMDLWADFRKTLSNIVGPS
jgi:hypothetical protein